MAVRSNIRLNIIALTVIVALSAALCAPAGGAAAGVPTGEGAAMKGAAGTPQVQVTEVRLGASLSGIDAIAFGGLAAGDAGPSAVASLVWQSRSQGWLTTWSLRIASDSGDFPLGDIALSSAWPQAGHTYRARLDLHPALDAVSVRVDDVTAGSTVFTGLIHLPEGDWELAAPEAAGAPGAPAGRVVLAEPRPDLATRPELYGLPLPLQQRVGFTLQVAGDPAPRQQVVLGEPVIIAFTWPQTYLPGEIEFRVETADGRHIEAGRAAWSAEPLSLPAPALAEAGPGRHRVVAAYVFGGARAEVAARELFVYSGVVDMQLRVLRVPSAYSVTDPGIEWTFHESEALEATFLVSSTGDAGGEIVLEAWTESELAAGAGGSPVAVVSAPLPAAEAGNVRLVLPLPAGGEPLRLAARIQDGAVALTGQNAISLRPAPVQWAIPGETGARAIAGLSHVPGVIHRTIYQATPEVGTFSHHAQIFYHDGVFYASWSNHRTDEDAPGQRILYSLSYDGEVWTEPRELFPPNDHPGGSGQDGRYMTAQRHSFRTGFAVVEGRVYALGTAMEWQAGSRRKLGELAREVRPDGALGPIFWLIPDPPRAKPGFPDYPSAADPAFRELAAGIVANASPITWNAYALKAADGHGIVELTSFVRPDGTGVLLGRDADNSRYMYASLGDPKARRWDPLVRVNIPDSPSLSDTGVLPDGRAYLIHNPASARDPLVISLSRDGIHFDRAWIIRQGAPPLAYRGMWKTRGYQYPSSVIAGDDLWVIYSDGKENVHVSKIPLESLGM